MVTEQEAAAQNLHRRPGPVRPDQTDLYWGQDAKWRRKPPHYALKRAC